jgi:hypothetical protein
MDVNQFWALIEKTRIENDQHGEQQAALLIQELVQLSLQDIIDFDNIFDDFCARADRAILQDAAGFIVAFGDSGWMDFRGWLVGQGQKAYESILTNPDLLAEMIPVEKRFEIRAELLLSAAQQAYALQTGNDPTTMPYAFDDIYEPFDRGETLWKRSSTWDEYCQLFAEKFPKIWAKFKD